MLLKLLETARLLFIWLIDSFYLFWTLFVCLQHGESEFNVIGRIGGDAGLSARGKLYAQALAKHITALNLPSLQVWTSTLQRTKATSANINAPQQHLHELDEIYSVSISLLYK